MWLTAQNAIRREARRAQGKQVRAPKDGQGHARSKQAWVLRQSRRRLLARLRKERRPFVQGRRRLWGKGPPTKFYSDLGAGLEQAPPIRFCPAHSPIGTPDSMLVEPPCSTVVSSPLLPQGLDDSEPIDDDMFKILDSSFDKPASTSGGLSTHASAFRFLARQAGVRC